MSLLELRPIQERDFVGFNRLLSLIGMQTPVGRVRKDYGKMPIQELAHQRKAQVDGYVFQSIADGAVIGAATATHYAREQIQALGLRCASKEALYLAELRIDPRGDRRARLEWKSALRRLLEASSAPCFTAVLDENGAAVRSFTRGREGIVYRPLYSYVTFILFGVHSWSDEVEFSESWILERQDADPEKIFLDHLSSYSKFLRGQSAAQPGSRRNCIFAVSGNQAQGIEDELARRGIDFWKIPGTLYEVHMNSEDSKIESTEEPPKQINLAML